MPASSTYPPTVDIDQAAAEILDKRRQIPARRSLLVGISGIDGCGKGYLTSLIVGHLQRQGKKAVGINIDGWLNLPSKRFTPNNPAEHFYDHAIRFDGLFTQLVLPLKEKRTHSLVADFAEETASEYRKHTYRFENIGIIVLEGIYLFKRAIGNTSTWRSGSRARLKLRWSGPSSAVKKVCQPMRRSGHTRRFTFPRSGYILTETIRRPRRTLSSTIDPRLNGSTNE